MPTEYSEHDYLRHCAPVSRYNVRPEQDAAQGAEANCNGGERRSAIFSSFGEKRPVVEKDDGCLGDTAAICQRTFRHCHKPRDLSLHDKVPRRQLLTVIILCMIFMTIEAIGGILSNSLALFTDVLHFGSDLINFLVCLFAQWMANKPATRKMTYGYHRAETLGAMFSVVFIWIVSGILCYIAGDRIVHGHYKTVKPNEMLITAAIGLFFNLLMGLSLHSNMYCTHTHKHSKIGHDHSHYDGKNGLGDGKFGTNCSHGDEGNGLYANNAQPSGDEQSVRKLQNITVRAAFIHIVGDTVQSFGVLVAAVIIKFASDESYKLADPVCTFIFSLVVLATTCAVLRDVLLIIMEGAPRRVSFESLKQELEALDGVLTVHSLHIWALTLDRNALSVHIAIENLNVYEHVLSSATTLVQDNHNIHFSAIQLELYHENMKNCEECMKLN